MHYWKRDKSLVFRVLLSETIIIFSCLKVFSAQFLSIAVLRVLVSGVSSSQSAQYLLFNDWSLCLLWTPCIIPTSSEWSLFAQTAMQDRKQTIIFTRLLGYRSAYIIMQPYHNMHICQFYIHISKLLLSLTFSGF